MKLTVPAKPSNNEYGESGVRASVLNASVFKNSANLIALYKCFVSFVKRQSNKKARPFPPTPWHMPGPLSNKVKRIIK